MKSDSLIRSEISNLNEAIVSLEEASGMGEVKALVNSRIAALERELLPKTIKDWVRQENLPEIEEGIYRYSRNLTIEKVTVGELWDVNFRPRDVKTECATSLIDVRLFSINEYKPEVLIKYLDEANTDE